MLKYRKAIFGMIFCGLVLLLCSYLVSAYSLTPYEQIDDWYGNKFNRVTVASTQSMVYPGQTFGTTYRVPDDFVVDNVLFYFAGRTGTWTAKNIRIGIQGVDPVTGWATLTWRGATNNGYYWGNPASLWNNWSLNEQVSLTQGEHVFVGYHDNGSKMSATVYLTCNRFGSNQESPAGMPPYGYYEELNHGVWRLGTAGSWILFENCQAFLLWNKTNNEYMGNPYTTVSTNSVYLSQCGGFNFTWDSDSCVSDKFAVMLRKNGVAYPNASINYVVYDGFGGGVLAGGVLAYPNASATSGGGRWNTVLMNSTISFVNGNEYFVKFWSKSGATYYWQVLLATCTAGAPYIGNTFQDTSSHWVYSADNGTTWSDNTNYDVQFMFRKIAGLVVADNSVNTSGTVEYSYRPDTGVCGEWWVWFNKSGLNGLSLFENFVNCVGTHEYAWNGTAHLVWANVTGSASSYVSVLNPNPGNGTHQTNYIKKASNLTTSLDISMKNFTTGGGLYEHLNTGENSVYGLFDSYDAQVFKIGNTSVNTTFIFNFAKIKFKTVIPGHNLTFYIMNTTKIGPHYIPNIGAVLSVVNNVSSYGFYEGWNTIDFPDIQLLKGGHYALAIKDFNYTIPMELAMSTNVLVNPYSGGLFCYYATWMPGWIGKADSDMLFEIYGNLSWNQCLNITFSDNSSGHWVVYNNNTYTWNQTVTVPFLNASGVDTYYWRMNYSNPNITGSTEIFSFTTINVTEQILPLTTIDYRYGLLFGGVAMMMLPIIKKKKKK